MPRFWLPEMCTFRSKIHSYELCWQIKTRWFFVMWIRFCISHTHVKLSEFLMLIVMHFLRFCYNRNILIVKNAKDDYPSKKACWLIDRMLQFLFHILKQKSSHVTIAFSSESEVQIFNKLGAHDWNAKRQIFFPRELQKYAWIVPLLDIIRWIQKRINFSTFLPSNIQIIYIQVGK